MMIVMESLSASFGMAGFYVCEQNIVLNVARAGYGSPKDGPALSN
jgi:hypothetical protein